MDHLSYERLNLYLDGALDREDMTDARGHLSGCSRCAETLAVLTGVRSAVRRSGSIDLPRSFATAVADGARARTHQTAEWSDIEKTAERVLTGLALTVALLWALTTGLNGTQEAQPERSAGLLEVYIRDSSMVNIVASETLTRDDMLAAALMQE